MKRLSTQDPLTSDDVAERFSQALLRVWRLSVEIRDDPDLRPAVERSRYLVTLPAVVAEELQEWDDSLPRVLVGLTEIAQRAGVQKPVVATWRTRHADFPTPLAELRTGAVWSWSDVRVWLASTGRRFDCELTVDEVNQSSGHRSENYIG